MASLSSGSPIYRTLRAQPQAAESGANVHNGAPPDATL
jgi:hypothetical protein